HGPARGDSRPTCCHGYLLPQRQMKGAWLMEVPLPAARLPYLVLRALRSIALRVFASSLCLCALFPSETPAAESQRRWDDSTGVVIQAGARAVRWGGNTAGDSLRLGFPAAKIMQTLREPSLKRPEGQRLLLAYDAESPEGVPLRIERRFQARTDPAGVALIEMFSLAAARPLTNDIEIEIPFAMPVDARRSASSLGNWLGRLATCPLKSGWAKSFPLTASETRVEYRLGNFITGKE